MQAPELKSLTHYHLLQSASQTWSGHPVQLTKNRQREYEPYTYDQFAEYSRAIAKSLLQLGLQKGDRVGIIADTCGQWLRISMGITSIGCVDVPRGTDATVDDISYIMNHARCSIVFIENGKTLRKLAAVLQQCSFIKKVVMFEDPGEKPEGSYELLLLDDLVTGGKALDDAEFHRRGNEVAESDLATIIYTSGTTGTPKGVMLRHGNMMWEVQTLYREFIKTGVQVGPGDVTMGFLPPWHSGERMFETICFYCGSAVAFTAVSELARDLKKARPTFLFTVPRVWENFFSRINDTVKKSPVYKRVFFNTAKKICRLTSLISDTALDRTARLDSSSALPRLFKRSIAALLSVLLLPLRWPARKLLGQVLDVMGGRLRYAFAGAGALPADVDRFMYSIGLPLIEVYGMTENSGVSTIRHHNRFSPGTVGRPLTGVEIELRDETGQVVTRPGIKGVAMHRGPHNMQGYYKEEEKTRAILGEDGWLNSGDLLMWTAQGDLKFAGRAKDTIVLSGGENVEPEPIENCLKQSDLFSQAVVVGQDKKTLGVLLVPDRQRILDALGENANGARENFTAHPAVQNLVKAEIKKYISADNGFKAFERVSSFCLLENDFSVNEELTQTMKVRRNFVQEKYEREINAMFQQ